MDPLDTTLVPRTRICPCGVRDLASVRTEPTVSRFSNVVACPIIHARVFQWYLHIAVDAKVILECLDHATHRSNCSFGHCISSVITQRRRFQGSFGSFFHHLLLQQPASLLVLHHCVRSLVWSQARPPTLPASRRHGVRCSLSLNGEWKDHSCS